MKTKRSKSIAQGPCNFPFADGRHCRMPRAHNHPSLCLFHARAEQQLLESHRVGAEIAASLTGNFLTAADINHLLGKVFTALAQNRIPQRTAATLGYLGQVMHHAIPNVRDETQFVYSFENWQKMIKRAVHLSDSWPTHLAPLPPDPLDGSPNGSPSSSPNISPNTTQRPATPALPQGDPPSPPHSTAGDEPVGIQAAPAAKAEKPDPDSAPALPTAPPRPPQYN